MWPDNAHQGQSMVKNRCHRRQRLTEAPKVLFQPIGIWPAPNHSLCFDGLVEGWVMLRLEVCVCKGGGGGGGEGCGVAFS